MLRIRGIRQTFQVVMAGLVPRLSGSIILVAAPHEDSRWVQSLTDKTLEFPSLQLVARAAETRPRRSARENSPVFDVAASICRNTWNAANRLTRLAFLWAKAEPDSRALVAAISVGEAAPFPIEMAGESSPHAASVFVT